ncbi:hypothetical protein CF319_g7983 [Tilletia indica]|nr:hypothetical protein CF319_g7983 [Tilletia indica]
MMQRSLLTTVVLALSLGFALATDHTEVRTGMNHHRDLDKQVFKKQAARGNAGATSELVMEDSSPMLPRIMLPMQIGSQGATANVYLAGLSSGCLVASGAYDPSKSSTAKDSHVPFNQGPSGPVYQGKIWTDTIKVAGLSARNVSIGSFPQKDGFGMCGIAWNSDNSFLGSRYRSFFFDMQDSGVLQPPNFSIQYSVHEKSTISFGSAVPAVGGHWYASDPEAPGFWTLQSKIASIASYMIIDPSATSIFGNSEDIQALFDYYGVGKNTFRDEDGLLMATFPCDQPPKVVIRVGELDVPLTKEVMAFGKDAKGNCVMPMVGDDNNQYPISLGSPFLASIKSIVFNIETHAMQIVPL